MMAQQGCSTSIRLLSALGMPSKHAPWGSMVRLLKNNKTGTHSAFARRRRRGSGGCSDLAPDRDHASCKLGPADRGDTAMRPLGDGHAWSTRRAREPRELSKLQPYRARHLMQLGRRQNVTCKLLERIVTGHESVHRRHPQHARRAGAAAAGEAPA